jgi:hypothetical protein
MRFWTRGASRRLALVALALLSGLAIRLSAQAVTVTRVGDAVTVHAPGIGFMKGETLVRLKDGRSVRVDLDLAVLPRPAEAATAQARQTFVLSYDLWEERFAVTQVGPPSRSIAYLTSAGAEAWCLEQLTVPVSALGRLGRDLPFWVRLGYRVLDADSAPPADGSGDFTLRGMIDALSRRRKAEAASHSIEAGPFRLTK